MKKTEYNPIENLQLYQGNQVQITMQDGSIAEGILFPAGEGLVTLKSGSDSSILEIDDIADIKYVGCITDYHTSGDSATLDETIGFTLADIADDELFEKMKYKEFDCTVCCYLHFNASGGRIEAGEVTLKEAVHVINGILLGKEYLYKLYADKKWKAGVLEKREEQYILLEECGVETTIAKKDIADITKMPMVNEWIEVTLADGRTYSGVVSAVHRDRVFLVEKNMGQLLAHMVLFEELREIRYSGRITQATSKFAYIDKKYSFKNPTYLRDRFKRVINGNRASFVVGINSTGLIAKDVVVNDQVGNVYTGIVLVVDWTGTNSTAYIGKTRGRITTVNGDVQIDKEILGAWLDGHHMSRFIDINKECFLVQYTLFDENATEKRGASIENCVVYRYGKYDATITVKDTPVGEEIQKEIVPVMVEKRAYYENKKTEIRYKGESGDNLLYTGMFEKSMETGAKLQGMEELLPWKSIEEVRIFGEITAYNPDTQQGKIDGEFFHLDQAEGIYPEVGMEVSYELVFAEPERGKGKRKGLLRCVNVRAYERILSTYIVNKVYEESEDVYIYYYFAEEDYLNGERDNLKQIVSKKNFTIPLIDKNDYKAEFFLQRYNGVEVLSNIKLVPGFVVPKEEKQENAEKAEPIEKKQYTAKSFKKGVKRNKGIVESYGKVLVIKDSEQEETIEVEKKRVESFIRFNELDLKIDTRKFNYEVEYSRQGKEVFFYEFVETPKSYEEFLAEKAKPDTSNNIEQDTIMQGTLTPSYMEGETVLIVEEVNEEKIFVYGSIAEIRQGQIVVRDKDGQEHMVDGESDRICRFGLLTGLNKECTDACMSNMARFSFGDLTAKAQGSIKTAKRKRMLAYFAYQNEIDEVYRASCNIEKTMMGRQKVQDEEFRAGDYVPWQSGVVSSISENEIWVTLDEPIGKIRNVKHYVAPEGSPLIANLIRREELVGRKVYVKVVAYPYSQNGVEKLSYSSIEIFPQSENLPLRYNDIQLRWEACIHATMAVEVQGDEAYLNDSEGSSVAVNFVPMETDGTTLCARIETNDDTEKEGNKTPILESELGDILDYYQKDREKAEQDIRGKLEYRAKQLLELLSDEEMVDTLGMQKNVDEFSYIASLLALGGENAALYRYYLFLTDFYLGAFFAEKYEASRVDGFHAEEALLKLFDPQQGQLDFLRVRSFVRHIAALDDRNFRWLMQNEEIVNNSRLGRKIYNEMQKEDVAQIFKTDLVESRSVLVRVRKYYRNQLRELEGELGAVDDCEAIAACMQGYLGENEDCHLWYFMGVSEEKTLREIVQWCREATLGCNTTEQSKNNNNYIGVLDKLEKACKKLEECPPRLVTELILRKQGRENEKSVLDVLMEQLENNLASYLQGQSPVLTCGIQGNEIVTGQKLLRFYVQNYLEDVSILQSVNNLKVKLELCADTAEGKKCIAAKEHLFPRLEGRQDRAYWQYIDWAPGLDYGIYPSGTKLELCVQMQYEAGENEEEEQCRTSISLEIVKRPTIGEESPYPKGNEIKKGFFFGRAEERKDIYEQIFQRKEDGNGILMRKGGKVYVYGQKQCGKTYLISQFYNGNVHKMVYGEEKKVVEDSVVISFGGIFDTLTDYISQLKLEETLSKDEKEQKVVSFYREQLRYLIAEQIQTICNVQNKEKPSGETPKPRKRQFSAESKMSTALAVEKEEKPTQVLCVGADITKCRDVEEFKSFVQAYPYTFVLILDEFTNYCEALYGMSRENIQIGLGFVSEFEKLGFVQIFIGHEGMYNLLDDMGMVNASTGKNLTLELQELDKPSAYAMIREPMQKALGYNPYDSVLGKEAENELLRLSGRNPKILSVLCGIMYGYLWRNSLEQGGEPKKYLTLKDVRSAIIEPPGVHVPSMFNALEKEESDHPNMVAEIRRCLSQLIEDNRKKEHRYYGYVKLKDEPAKNKTEIDLIKKLYGRRVLGKKKNGNYYIKVGWFEEYIKSLKGGE